MIAKYYDQLNPWGKYDDFFIELLKLTQANKVADLGCGTGRVTIEIAKAGYEVTAIDPDADAIHVAKNKEGAQFIHWIVGDSQDLTEKSYDAVVMTANVAQVFVTDASWQTVLQDAYAALKTGGHLLFDTRNPSAKAWEEWLKDDTVEQLQDLNTGASLQYWDEYEGLVGNIFTFHQKIKNDSMNITHEAKVELIFRSYEEIVQSLNEVGFTIENVYADGEFTLATSQSKSFIFHCKK